MKKPTPAEKTEARELVKKTNPLAEEENERRMLFVAEYYKKAPSENLVVLSKRIGIPFNTLRSWSATSWFRAAVEKYGKDLDVLMDRRISNLLTRTFEELEDRIENGDEKVSREGELFRTKMSGKDIATVTGVLFDRREKLRKVPGEEKTDDFVGRLGAIADKLRGYKGPTQAQLDQPIDVEAREVPSPDEPREDTPDLDTDAPDGPDTPDEPDDDFADLE